ncbi:exosome exoribonuclease [Scheffersomyces xylosifermentans]|uniref:exosome exoribonuclease n=1 Tax=Scheffersomyces xylosifermentans TaxID=1304137 RepID=UPI00315D9627
MSDRRRLIGPLNTIIPNIGISSNATEADVFKGPSSATRNEDGLRQFFLKTGIIENANGSAYLEVGGNIIQVSVFGPRPIRGSFVDRASFSVECKFLPYISQPNEQLYNNTTVNAGSTANTGPTNANANGRTGLTNIEQKISSYIETALLPSIVLEKYPKSTIDIFVTILSTESSNSGSTKVDAALLGISNWVLNCSSVALVDSGIELKDVVTSGVATLKNDKLLLDPEVISSGEDNENTLTCVVSFMNLRNDEIVGFWMEGDQSKFEESQVEQLIDGCNNMSRQVRANINSYFTSTLE